MQRRQFLTTAAALAVSGMLVGSAGAAGKEIVYLAPGLDVPFWRTVSNGVEAGAKAGGYTFQALEAQNNAQKQLQNAQDAITRGVAGIVISPTDSSTAPSVLKLAAEAGIPVVICDIGTNEGEYLSFIASDNSAGAVGVGQAVAAAAKAKGLAEAPYGMITISLARINGQKRTEGFRSAMEAAGFGKEVALQQMQAYTADESFKFAQDMLTGHPEMKAMFIQSDTTTLGALRAIKAGNRSGDVIVGAFDGIPEFVDLLKSGELTAAGMQQPYLMGESASKALIDHFAGKTPPKEILVPVMIATSTNIEELLPEAKRTVFGQAE